MKLRRLLLLLVVLALSIALLGVAVGQALAKSLPDVCRLYCDILFPGQICIPPPPCPQ
jgi:hypothetical protein